MLNRENLLAKKIALQEQMSELQKQLDLMTANGNAISGAIQFCDDLIAELEKSEKEEVSK